MTPTPEIWGGRANVWLALSPSKWVAITRGVWKICGFLSSSSPCWKWLGWHTYYGSWMWSRICCHCVKWWHCWWRWVSLTTLMFCIFTVDVGFWFCFDFNWRALSVYLVKSIVSNICDTCDCDDWVYSVSEWGFLCSFDVVFRLIGIPWKMDAMLSFWLKVD